MHLQKSCKHNFHRQRRLTFRLPLVVKALPQMLQANGFSPVWVRSWICRALADEKFLPQTLHMCCLVDRRGAAEMEEGRAVP